MTSNKITIKFNNKEYEIENKKEEQKVSPKGKTTRSTEDAIKVKDYNEGFWTHSCQCSKDGTNWNKIDIKWGTGRHVTIWGTSSILLVVIGLGIWYYFFKGKKP